MQIQQALRLPRVQMPARPGLDIRKTRMGRETGAERGSPEEEDLGYGAVLHGRLKRRAVKEVVKRNVDVAEVQIDQLVRQISVNAACVLSVK